MEGFMRGEELAEFLQVRMATLSAWDRANLLAIDGRLQGGPGPGHPMFGHSTIEAFLRSQPNHKKALVDMPTVTELLVLSQVLHVPPLLTLAQARAWLRLPQGMFNAALRNDLPSIRLAKPRGDIRVLLTALVDYAEKICSAVPATLASLLLGVGPAKISELAPHDDSGPLIRLTINRQMFVTMESLMQLITANLNTGTAAGWWLMRVQHEFEPFMSIDQFRTRYNIRMSRVLETIGEGSIPCLFPPGNASRVSGISRIPPYAAEQWANANIRLSNNQVGRLLATEGWIIGRKWGVGAICPRYHVPHITRDCLLAFLTANQTSSFPAKAWLAEAEMHKKPSVRVSELPSQAARKAMQAIKSGTLRGIRLPDDSIVVLRADAESLQS